MEKPKAILEQALRMKPADKFMIIEALVNSLDEPDKRIDEIWATEAWPFERSEIRKCFVHKFPDKVLCSVQDPNIVILAIAHQHRKPGYWIDEAEK